MACIMTDAWISFQNPVYLNELSGLSKEKRKVTKVTNAESTETVAVESKDIVQPEVAKS